MSAARAKALALLALLPAALFAADVKVIPPRDYFATALKEINAAQSSVALYMFTFSLRPNDSGSKVLELADALKRAHARGVKVEAVLDQSLFLDSPGPPEAKNFTAYSYLKAAGIPVFLDTPGTIAHAKALIIDGRTVLMGSTNWSDSALEKNQEANVLIRSTAAAQELLTLLAPTPRRQLPAPGPAVPLPARFLTDGSLFGRMVTEQDQHAFNLYLFLLWKNAVQNGQGKVALHYAELAPRLNPKFKPDAPFKGHMSEVLKKLRDQYKLLEFETSRGKPAEVRLAPLEGEPVNIPPAYWDFGWDQRLKLRGKALYLINLRESAISPISPRWSWNRDDIAERYGIAVAFITNGTAELRRANLLEVEYDTLTPDGQGLRYPNTYYLKPLYNPADLEKGLANLRAQYGPAKLQRAQKAAAVVYADSNLKGIESLIDLEKRFGQHEINRALEVVRAKSGANPKRNIAYLIGTIRRSGANE